MSVVRHLATAVLTTSAVLLSVPTAFADPIPPRPASPQDSQPSGQLTVKRGDRTETWTWGPNQQAYKSTRSTSSQSVQGEEDEEDLLQDEEDLD